MSEVRVTCKQTRKRILSRSVQKLLVTTLLGVCGGVWAQVSGADPATGTPELLKQQGQQKQLQIQGQAATQLSHGQAKQLAASAPQASLQPSAQPGQPVTEEAVQLKREERIRRLNAAKVGDSAAP